MKKYLLPVALLLGLCFDLLFWGKTPGISFFIFIVLCLVSGFFLIKADHLHPGENQLAAYHPDPVPCDDEFYQKGAAHFLPEYVPVHIPDGSSGNDLPRRAMAFFRDS